MTSNSIKLDETEGAVEQSLFNKLPNEITLHIFRFLSVDDLFNISLVCRSFKMIADHDEIWKPKCNNSKKPYSKSYRAIYIEWMHEKSLQEISDSYTIGFMGNPTPPAPIRPACPYPFKPIGGFNQHPNSTEELTINLSVDIDKTTPELIALLERMFQSTVDWEESDRLKHMICRYYRFMQLKASHPPNILLIPTLDIEIVWQTHLLRPEMYRADCLRLFRRIIHHSLILNDVESFFKEQALFDTYQLYEQKFGEEYYKSPLIKKKKKKEDRSIYQDETIYSYSNHLCFHFLPNTLIDYENPFSFTETDIILDGKWMTLCKEFIYRARCKFPYYGPIFYSSTRIDLYGEEMKRLKKSYERFLYMAAKYPFIDGNDFIPPTYAIDIIWHSHMQEPLNYEADCIRLVGYVIDHDPCPAIKDEKMKNSCDQIWKDEFQCDIGTDHL